MQISKTFTARHQVYLVGGKSQVSDDQVLVWKANVEQRFPVTEVLHPFGQRVADQRDSVAVVQLKELPGVGCWRSSQNQYYKDNDQRSREDWVRH